INNAYALRKAPTCCGGPRPRGRDDAGTRRSAAWTLGNLHEREASYGEAGALAPAACGKGPHGAVPSRFVQPRRALAGVAAIAIRIAIAHAAAARGAGLLVAGG